MELIILVLIVGAAYFLFVRPRQQREQQREKDRREQLRAFNDAQKHRAAQFEHETQEGYRAAIRAKWDEARREHAEKRRDEGGVERPDDGSRVPLDIFIVASILKSLVSESEPGSPKWMTAAAVLSEISDGKLELQDAALMMAVVSEDRPSFGWLLPLHMRLRILRGSLDIVAPNGSIPPHARSSLEDLCVELEVPSSQLDELAYEHESAARERGAVSDENFRFLMLMLIASLVNPVASASGHDSSEWARAVEFLVAISDGELEPSSASHMLNIAPEPSDATLLQLPNELRLSILRFSIEIAAADGAISATEWTALRDLASKLELPPDAVEKLVQVLIGENDETIQALRLLGLNENTTTSDIRNARRRLLERWHPDRHPESSKVEATERSAKINAAYDYLMTIST